MTTNTNTIFLSDKTAFESIFRQFYSELCSFAFNFLKAEEDAEEIVQQVFVGLWNNREKIEISTSPKSYLYLSVRNACLNKIKHIKIREEYKEYNQREIESSFADTDSIVNATELEEKIRNTIDKMPVERRKIFIMSRFDNLSYKEIAEKLNISPKTVENQIGSALKFLRQELKDYLVVFLLLFFKL